jgi:S-formylglutathione hydrolase FrmB
MIPDQSSSPFRVVYLLHGLHGSQGTWLDNTQLPVFAKKYNAIFVMPEASRSYYVNLKYGRKYYDYISDELPSKIRKIFNITADRENTAVMGCSMGGFGALRMALTKPEQYGFCGAISSACLYFKHVIKSLQKDPTEFLKTVPEADELLTDFYMIYGEKMEYRDDYDVVELVKNFPDTAPKPKIFATCGIQDSFREDNLRFRTEMESTDFDFSYEEWTGGHDWYFFNDALKKTLELWFA